MAAPIREWPLSEPGVPPRVHGVCEADDQRNADMGELDAGKRIPKAVEEPNP